MALLYLVFVYLIFMGKINTEENEDSSYWMEIGQKALDKALSKYLNKNVAKNVILFIGDGMGVSTVTAARILRGQLNNHSGEENLLEFEKFPDVAVIKTYSVDYQVADSAATATAIYSGVKTRSGILGYNSLVSVSNCSTEDEAHKVTSIATRALNTGKAVGVVTTTRITHATPAALYAHSVDRDWEYDGKIPKPCSKISKDIAKQLIEDMPGKDFKVILGGGRQYFKPSQSVLEPGSRADQIDLVNKWENNRKIQNVPYRYVTNLKELTNVSADTEYLLGGRIDHGHHAGQAMRALVEVLDFEDAIREAVKLTNEKDTLIVVTADHSHTLVVAGYPQRGNPIGSSVDTALGLDEIPYTTLLYGNGPGFKIVDGKRQNVKNFKTDLYTYEQQAAVPLKQESHGGEDILVYAKGPMSHLFHSLQEQNYIAFAINYAACIDDLKAHCTEKKSPSESSSFRLSSLLLAFIIIMTQIAL